MKKQITVLCLILTLVFSGCSVQGITETAQGNFKTTVDKNQILTARSPANNATVTLINTELVQFLENHYLGKGLREAGRHVRDGATSVPVTLSWESGKENNGYTLIYTTREDFSDAVQIRTEEPQVVLEDLTVATTFYWQVVTHLDKGDNYSTVFAFYTADTPRWITAEGAYNTRDLGGYLTEDGKFRVKQGMIYRGSALEKLTDAGKEKLLTVYGIKTDLDLRNPEDIGFTGMGSPLGDTVNYINVQAGGYRATIINEETAEKMVQEIRVYTQADAYPVYAHCSAGRDRGGTLMFYLGALLGLSKETLIADWEMTYLTAKSYGQGDNTGQEYMETFLAYFEALEGTTYQEKAEKFLLSKGLTQEELQIFRDLMLVPVE